MSDIHYSGSDIRHSSLFSYVSVEDKKEYYTTVEDNELIEFRKVFGQELHANFIWIEAIDSALYISMNDTKYLIYVPAGHAREISYLDVTNMRICCPVGTKLRYYIQTF
jgi:hypothetical protein